jgi:hypothetical protein
MVFIRFPRVKSRGAQRVGGHRGFRSEEPKEDCLCAHRENHMRQGKLFLRGISLRRFKNNNPQITPTFKYLFRQIR